MQQKYKDIRSLLSRCRKLVTLRCPSHNHLGDCRLQAERCQPAAYRRSSRSSSTTSPPNCSSWAWRRTQTRRTTSQCWMTSKAGWASSGTPRRWHKTSLTWEAGLRVKDRLLSPNIRNTECCSLRTFLASLTSLEI